MVDQPMSTALPTLKDGKQLFSHPACLLGQLP
jgi:hypothetical protein